ncbi:MAG: BrnA antitoxin family protein [Caulobacter sp.]|nr:BrnA antitoxin family protein [Caulobacter sp.]
MPENGNNTRKPWIDPDDAPEWSDAVFDRAEIRDGAKLVRPASGTLTRRGRPRLENPKRQVTVRLDHDIIETLRSSGPGWQGRMNAILRLALKG